LLFLLTHLIHIVTLATLAIGGKAHRQQVLALATRENFDRQSSVAAKSRAGIANKTSTADSGVCLKHGAFACGSDMSASGSDGGSDGGSSGSDGGIASVGDIGKNKTNTGQPTRQ
jgi:hypothetical protein